MEEGNCAVKLRSTPCYKPTAGKYTAASLYWGSIEGPPVLLWGTQGNSSFEGAIACCLPPSAPTNHDGGALRHAAAALMVLLPHVHALCYPGTQPTCPFFMPC